MENNLPISLCFLHVVMRGMKGRNACSLCYKQAKKKHWKGVNVFLRKCTAVLCLFLKADQSNGFFFLFLEISCAAKEIGSLRQMYKTSPRKLDNLDTEAIISP
jgi:hypothetical protein